MAKSDTDTSKTSGPGTAGSFPQAKPGQVSGGTDGKGNDQSTRN